MFELPHVCAILCVRLLEGCIAKAVFFCFYRNLHFLGFTVLPWQATVLPQELVALRFVHGPLGARYYRYLHGSNFLLPLNKRYYRPACGTSARAVLPR